MKEIEDQHRLTISCLLAHTENKCFFQQHEFEKYYGKIMVAVQLRNAAEKKFKEK